MPARLGIALGDPTGIGPEVTLKALAMLPKDGTRYLLLGDPERLNAINQKLALHLPLQRFESWNESGRFLVFNPLRQPVPDGLAPGHALAAQAAMAWLTEGAQRALRHDVDALVTAPVNKEAIINSGFKFVGQTEYLSQMANETRTAMMLLGTDDRGRWLRVALATTHVALREVAHQLTAGRIQQAIELTVEACSKLKLGRARIGVCGLNPHAGEGGKMGGEEIQLIAPAVEAVQRAGLDVAGPLPADTLFHQAYRGDFDAVVAMYHDQGLAPLKMIAFETGVNWTLGLPFVRTSPDHGTAYDIAGQGVANPTSMIAAIQLAKDLAIGEKRT